MSESPRPSRQPRILGIDDSLTIRKLLEMVLVKAGYALELAPNGTEGIARAKRNPPDMILLDFVLPDMKGLDVCHALAQDENTRFIPVVLMSAKSEDVRHLFADIRSVVDFVTKPFTPPEITFAVSKVLKARMEADTGSKIEPSLSESRIAAAKPAGPATPAPFTFAQKEAGARVIYSKLRDRFGKIPAWLPQLSNEPPELFFAKKILTPEVMEAIMTGLAPLLRTESDATKNALPPTMLLQGQTSMLPLLQLIKLLNSCGRNGVLTVEHPDRTTWLYARRGEVILATNNRPEEYVRQAHISSSTIVGTDHDSAEREQRASGKPVFVTYAEAGKLPASELPGVLYQQGKRVLLEAIDAGPGSFAWKDLNVLPEYVEAYGKACTLEQLQLERLRGVDDWTQVELHVNSLELVYQRCDHFSKTLQKFELAENERRVLTLVDQRNTIRQIIERSGVTTFEVFHILFRLGQVGLITKKSQTTSGLQAAIEMPRPVMIAEPDLEGVQIPLAKLLRRRTPIPLVNLNDTLVGASETTSSHALIERFLKERPRLVILNASVPGLEVEKTAREIRSTLEISDMALAVVLEQESAGKADALRAAGVNTVLVKPFLFRDIEPLLVA